MAVSSLVDVVHVADSDELKRRSGVVYVVPQKICPKLRLLNLSNSAGNSSKAAPLKNSEGTEDRPLFPPGYKYPVSLLHEK